MKKKIGDSFSCQEKVRLQDTKSFYWERIGGMLVERGEGEDVWKITQNMKKKRGNSFSS